MRFLCFILLLSSTPMSWAQPDLNAMRKEIPVKKVKKVLPSRLADNLFVYEAKADSGLWDNDRKKVVLHHLKDLDPCEHQKGWQYFYADGKYGLVSIANSEVLISSRHPFKLEPCQHTGMLQEKLLTVIGKDVMGFINANNDERVVVAPDRITSTTAQTLASSDDFYFVSAYYDSSSKSVRYLNDNLEIYESVDWYHLDNYLVEVSSFDGTRVYDLKSMKVIANLSGHVRKHGEYYKGGSEYGLDMSFYDKDFTPIVEDMYPEDMEAGDLRKFFNVKLRSSEHVGMGVFLCRREDEAFFYSVGTEEVVAGPFDRLWERGEEIYGGGDTYYTEKDGKFGLFDVGFGELCPPKYNKIETRMTWDGEHVIAMDDSWWRYRYDERIKSDSLQVWEEDMEQSSILLSLLNNLGGQLLISPRNSKGDTHDYGYSTSTVYEDGAGIYDLKAEKWIQSPKMHSLLPFKGRYIGLQTATSYYNWCKVYVMDSDLKVLNTEELSGGWIYNGKLIAKLDYKYVVYDVVNNKVEKTLGESEFREAFRLEDGFLLLGHNEFTRGGSVKYFDPYAIITPDFRLVMPKGIMFTDDIQDGLMIVGEAPAGDIPTDRDVNRRNFHPQRYAVYDMRTQKVISPWYNSLHFTYNSLESYDAAEDHPEWPNLEAGIPTSEVRSTFRAYNNR